jgi:predicted  nucleic acid-binding Zn-ribbon protein
MIRELKHDNQWLKTTNEGLQSECTVLKELLRDQKDIITECNSDLRMANEEISRLEDCLHAKSSELNKLETTISQKEVEIDSKNKTATQL